MTVAHRQAQDQDSRSRIDFARVTDIFTAAVHRNQATIISTIDGSGQNMGSAVLLHDDDVVYLWLAARRRVPGNRAYARLVWEAFRFARERGLTLDLDGYASPHAARYLANFGGLRCPRNRVSATNLRARCLIVARAVTERLISR